MRLYERIEAFQKPSKAIVSMGTFDGVHLGHQQLLQQALKNSREVGGEAVVVTFWPHPKLVLAHTHQTPTQLLTTFDEKVTTLAQLGVDHLLKLPFTKTLSQLSAHAFVQQVLVAQVGVIG
jgi:riboflavin kinase / FMN adenylyltransferase